MKRGLMLALGVGTALAARSVLRRKRMEDLSGEVVLITGGSRGLGFAMAREFARQGCKLAICARDYNELDRARSLLQESGAEVLAVCCDISDEEQVRELIQAVRAHYGRIDNLVNNAGVMRVGPVENMTARDFEEAMEVMFWGVVRPTLAVLDEMKARGRGRIATVASIGGRVSVPHLLPYCCAKFAAVGFCEGLQAEVSRHGIQVLTVAPGLMRTGGHRKAEFKGRRHSEAAWFSLAATLPVISMSAERAARQIVNAIREGRTSRILTVPANVMARLNGLMPGMVPRVFGIVNRLLPTETPDRESILTGAEAEAGSGRLLRAVTVLGRKAASRLNAGQQPSEVLTP